MSANAFFSRYFAVRYCGVLLYIVIKCDFKENTHTYLKMLSKIMQKIAKNVQNYSKYNSQIFAGNYEKFAGNHFLLANLCFLQYNSEYNIPIKPSIFSFLPFYLSKWSKLWGRIFWWKYWQNLYVKIGTSYLPKFPKRAVTNLKN